MNRKHFSLLVILIFFQHTFLICAPSEILHTHTIDAVLQHVERSTDLIVFDLDETLISLDHGEHWVSALCKHYEITEFENIESFYIWHARQDEHYLLESHAPEVIAQLQQQRNPVVALTARSTVPYIQHTYVQLQKLGSDFSQSRLADTDFTIPASRPAFYYRGIISAGDNSKGPILLQMLERLHMHPTKIIFID